MNLNNIPEVKTINLQELVKIIRPGMRIFLSSGPALPLETVTELFTHKRIAGYDLEIIQIMPHEEFPGEKVRKMTNHTFRSFCSLHDGSGRNCSELCDYIPAETETLSRLFSSGAMETDLAIICMSPPDRAGYMSLGTAADAVAQVIKNTPVTAVLVNSLMPRTWGDTLVHIIQADYLVNIEEPLPSFEPENFSLIEEEIGKNIASLINDGTTVSLHQGRLFNAVSAGLKGKRELGILTDFVSDWAIDLAQCGAISYSRSREEGGQISASYCCGSPELYEYIDMNPLFGFYAPEKLACPDLHKKIFCLTDIADTERIDICAEKFILRKNMCPFTRHMNTGTASSADRTVIAVSSLDSTGRSRIVMPRDIDTVSSSPVPGTATHVVTEFGTACIYGKSLRERALCLIEIAHPDFREELFNSARGAGLIYPDQDYKTISCSYPSALQKRERLDDGTEIIIRPIRPSDEEMMRRLFYKFSPRSRYLRFFSNVSLMPHSKMQRYISVDYDKKLSLVAVSFSSGIEKIICEARYAAYSEGDAYDIAFLVDEEFQDRGICTLMAEYLISIARDRGIKTIMASVLPENSKMLHVIEKLSVKPEKHYEEGLLEMNFSL